MLEEHNFSINFEFMSKPLSTFPKHFLNLLKLRIQMAQLCPVIIFLDKMREVIVLVGLRDKGQH